jgi:hypothetical protein
MNVARVILASQEKSAKNEQPIAVSAKKRRH